MRCQRVLIGETPSLKDKAPATYMIDADIFPSEASLELLEPHFIDAASLPVLLEATESLPDSKVTELLASFTRRRQAAMLTEIRRVCAVRPPSADATSDESDDLAADLHEQIAHEDGSAETSV